MVRVWTFPLLYQNALRPWHGTLPVLLSRRAHATPYTPRGPFLVSSSFHGLDCEPLQFNCPRAVAYVEIIYDYTAVTSTGYSEGVVYSYSTSCPTSYHSRRSISNGQASVGPGVVGVARSLCIVVSLGLMVCYFPLVSSFLYNPRHLFYNYLALRGRRPRLQAN